MPDPVAFTDSLTARAYQVRPFTAGNPYAFLNGVGLEAICERIFKAANLIDVARELNISVTILLNWIENEGHAQKIEDAIKFSSEGYVSEAAQMLRTATNEFELRKAKEVASHGRFMASKLDKPKYGADAKHQGTGIGVTFVMHMGQNLPAQTLQLSPLNTTAPKELGFINGSYSLVEHANQDAAYTEPTDAAEPDSLGPFEDPPLEPSEHNIPEYLK